MLPGCFFFHLGKTLFLFFPQTKVTPFLHRKHKKKDTTPSCCDHTSRWVVQFHHLSSTLPGGCSGQLRIMWSETKCPTQVGLWVGVVGKVVRICVENKGIGKNDLDILKEMKRRCPNAKSFFSHFVFRLLKLLWAWNDLYAGTFMEAKASNMRLLSHGISAFKLLGIMKWVVTWRYLMAHGNKLVMIHWWNYIYIYTSSYN